MASVGTRYARAFADVVIDLKLDPNAVRQEMKSIIEIVNANGDLRRVWESPAVTAEQKLKVLDALVQRAGLATAVRNFLAVLIDHRRMNMLASIAHQFELELNQRLGFSDAEIVSARELDAAERQALEARVAAITGKKVRAEYKLDVKLLGGAVVRLGSTIYDGSLRGQLHRMRTQLSEA
ncbi:MAG TPA: ATP synthase F1 subunit delta [Anaerolineae bacterium]